MDSQHKRIVGLGGTTLLAVVAGVTPALAVAQEAQDPADQASAVAVESQAADAATQTTRQAPQEVIGSFQFNQGVPCSLEDVSKAMATSSKYLCGSAFSEIMQKSGHVSDAEDWRITIRGAVENGYSATFGELAEDEGAQSVVMSCSCAGNPADGASSTTAEVTGLNMARLVELANPTEGANTIVFDTADGYQVALPLGYVLQRYCPLVFAVNGSPLVESVGGVNQLWLGSTSARYFARDVVSITLEERETPPPAPGTSAAGDACANLPNVGIAFGGEIS